MRGHAAVLSTGLFLAAITPLAMTETRALRVPRVVEAGSTFSIGTGGTGKVVLYLAGPAGAIRRTAQAGEDVVIGPADLSNAGHYLAVLVGESFAAQAEFDIIARPQPAAISFLAKPSRLPVDQHDGISGVVYVLDSFRNLILAPLSVSFRLSGSGGVQTKTVGTRGGVAWVKMDSTPKAGVLQLNATVGVVTGKRVVQQVPGDPCSLKMSARSSGGRVLLETAPVRDCRGNAVPDGTIVTFSETYDGNPRATVDVPLKRDVARTEMPAHPGAVISVATGVVMGNEIRLGATP
jgi:hypothetical protein